MSTGECIDEVVVGDCVEDDGLGADDATVVWLLRCDIRSSLDENRLPQKSLPLIQLQTKGDEPPIEDVEVVVGIEEDELKDVVVIGDDC